MKNRFFYLVAFLFLIISASDIALSAGPNCLISSDLYKSNNPVEYHETWEFSNINITNNSNDICRFSVNQKSGTPTRKWAFSDDGRFHCSMVYTKDNSGYNTDGTHVHYLWPTIQGAKVIGSSINQKQSENSRKVGYNGRQITVRAIEKKYSLSNQPKIQTSSGNLVTFKEIPSNKNLAISVDNCSLDVSDNPSPSDGCGIKKFQCQNNIVIDLKWYSKNDPTYVISKGKTQLSAKISDPIGNTCTVEVRELFKKNSAYGDPIAIHQTPESQKRFLQSKCPNLDLSSFGSSSNSKTYTGAK